MERSVVATEKIASDWLIDQLHLTLARRDLAVIVQANPAWRNHNLPRIRALNDWVLQTRETSEMRLQAEQMGCSLLDWLRNHDGANAAHISAWGQMQPTYPVAFTLAASQTAAGVGDCMLAYAFGWGRKHDAGRAHISSPGPKRRSSHPGQIRPQHPGCGRIRPAA